MRRIQSPNAQNANGKFGAARATARKRRVGLTDPDANASRSPDFFASVPTRGVTMHVLLATEPRADDLSALFAAVFSASEGPQEGRAIGDLVHRLLKDTPRDELVVFCATEGKTILGAVLFSRLRFAQDSRSVFLLSPMAVRTDRQGTGIGQVLIRHALAHLAEQAVDVVVTYGDPAFYGRTGFRPIPIDVLPPPLPLSHPEGWIAQSLSDQPLSPFAGPSSCVAALNDPAFW
jgi:putative acetyltransferase